MAVASNPPQRSIADDTARNREAVLLRSDQEVTLWFAGNDTACIVVWVPDELVGGLGLQNPDPVVMEASLLVSAGQGLAAAALQNGGKGAPERGECHVMERLLLGLVFGLLIENDSPGQGPDQIVTVSQMEKAHALIMSHLHSPGYSTEQLAKQLGMSPRQLQRLFARFGTTPSETLRRFRAEIAESLLRGQEDGAAEKLTVTEIADRAGFSSAAAMRRALRGQRQGDGMTDANAAWRLAGQ